MVVVWINTPSPTIPMQACPVLRYGNGIQQAGQYFLFYHSDANRNPVGGGGESKLCCHSCPVSGTG